MYTYTAVRLASVAAAVLSDGLMGMGVGMVMLMLLFC